MAATVLSDPYSVLIRRVGFSVGLENTRARLIDLTRSYSELAELTIPKWGVLIHELWRLKGANSARHVANFFRSLDLIQVKGGSLFVLPTLDTLAILYRLNEGISFERALDFVFCKQILLADGDIFLNCLAAEFKVDGVKANLQEMIRTKRQAVQQAFKNRALLERLFRIISIEVQKENAGGAGTGKSLSERTRTTPLPKRETSLSAVPTIEPEDISDDYLRKVPLTRRGWAKALGLCEEGGRLTSRGRTFLAVLERAGFKKNGVFLFWPLHYELLPLRISAASLGAPDLDTWKYLLLVFEALGGERTNGHPSESEISATDLLLRCYTMYRDELSLNRRLFRSEMPVEILYSVALGKAFAQHEQPVDIDSILRAPAHDSRIQYRSSRYFEGAIAVRG